MQYTIPTFTSLNAIRYALLEYQRKKRKIENELESKRIDYDEFMEKTGELKADFLYQTTMVKSLTSIAEKDGQSLDKNPFFKKRVNYFESGARKTTVKALKFEEDIRLDLEFELDCLEKQEASINDVLAQLAARKKELEKEAGITSEEPVTP